MDAWNKLNEEKMNAESVKKFEKLYDSKEKLREKIPSVKKKLR